ncbi:NlpC/P60 family protein [Nocardia sp. XZ_19_385]|uniref:NlpC/P60 family protein n=1 Tax=Nocardia sp. XZ_19_385 TaxID=2769488 RepID=UPI00188F3756|nr:NlpC/P60 family protein [Nocardia sp. XZ_19_385]
MRTNGDPVKRRPLSVALGLLICAVVCATAGPGRAVPPAPPNPSDGQIAEAGAQVEARVGEVGALINEVAAADQQLQELDAAVAARREAVNKALVDLQIAREAADVAAARVQETQGELAGAASEVDEARKNFDSFATQAYTRPGMDSMLSHLGAESPGDAIDRSQIIGLVSKNKQQMLTELRRAQIELGNKNSVARQAKAEADAAAAAAEQAKLAAEQAVAAAKAELEQQTVRRDQLQRDRSAAQARLEQARTNVAGLQDQRQAFVAWDERRQAEDAAMRRAAAEARARAGGDQAAQDRAAALAEGSRPHTSLNDDGSPRRSKSRPSQPSVRGSAAIEIVVDRALSQLGVIYAWGGGDENGPTLGIRDGGVADAHGDFEKVGFDCSGLMIYAFAGIGLSLPHYSGYQYTMGTRVPVEDRQRGDMLFWGANGSAHVALYLGDGQMVEAPQSGDVVKVTSVREGGIMPYAVRLVN